MWVTEQGAFLLHLSSSARILGSLISFLLDLGLWICTYDARYDPWHDIDTPSLHILPFRLSRLNATSPSRLILYMPPRSNIERPHPLLLTFSATTQTHLYGILTTPIPYQSPSLVLQPHNRIRMSYTALALTTIPIIQSFTSFQVLRQSPRQSLLSTRSFSVSIYSHHSTLPTFSHYQSFRRLLSFITRLISSRQSITLSLSLFLRCYHYLFWSSALLAVMSE